jgi:hypothetical protein
MAMDISDEDIIIKFGKYRGERLGDLPLSYLKWLAENINEDSPQNKRLCYAADRLYQERKVD